MQLVTMCLETSDKHSISRTTFSYIWEMYIYIVHGYFTVLDLYEIY